MKKGFTAIELIVVLIIMVVLIGAIAPMILNYLPGVQLNGSSRVMTAALREAQEKAVTEQDQYLIRFTQKSPPTFQLIKIDEGAEQVIREERFSSRIELGLTPDIPQIIFSPDGGPNSALEIVLSINSAQRKITISPAGFIKIE